MTEDALWTAMLSASNKADDDKMDVDDEGYLGNEGASNKKSTKRLPRLNFDDIISYLKDKVLTGGDLKKSCDEV